MHKTNCMQSIEQISTWEVFSILLKIIKSPKILEREYN